MRNFHKVAVFFSVFLFFLSGCMTAPVKMAPPPFHVWTYLDKLGEEPHGYATYSYVLAGRGTSDLQQAERYKALVTAIQESTPGTSDVSMSTPRSQMNLFLIPWKERSATWNLGLSLSLSSVLAASNAHFRNPGPFLVTLYEPIGLSSDAEAVMLFVDLTNTHPEAMREVVAVYKQRISEAPLQGIERLQSLKLTLLNIALISEDQIGFAKAAYADLRTTLFPQ